MPRIDSREQPGSATGPLAKDPRTALTSREDGDSPLRGVVVSPTPKTRLTLFDPEVGAHLITSATQASFDHLHQGDRGDDPGDPPPQGAGVQPDSEEAAPTGAGDDRWSPRKGAPT